MSHVNVAVLGAGARGWWMGLKLLEAANQDIRIASVYDPDRGFCERAKERWHSPDTKICGSAEEAIAFPGVDWVMVMSPNACHKAQIVAAFAAGKHVFSEKPLATTIADCVEVCQAHKKSGRVFATGFVMRYAPICRKARELVSSGKIGKIITIEANENIDPRHGAHIMTNWRRHRELSGPHILEKCCHDLDIMNWLVGDLPAKVAAFGGRDLFRAENAHMYKKFTAPDGKSCFDQGPDPRATAMPFTDDTDQADNTVSILEYRNGARAMFQTTMSNAMPERRSYICGTEGSMIIHGRHDKGLLEWKRLDDEGVTSMAFPTEEHSGGDRQIAAELHDTMVNGAPPKCGGQEGLQNAVVALSIEKAREEGEVIRLGPVWESLGA